MAKVNEGAHLYDAAEDAIDLDYSFSDKKVEVLFDMFNETTPKLLELYERREFFTYFFLGIHAIPELTPQQAWDFKTSFDISNFPANGIKEYNKWLKSNGNNYVNAFPYPVVGGDGKVKQNKWKVAYVGDILNDLTYLVNNQENYKNWLTNIQHGVGSWESAFNNLATAGNVSDYFAKLAGLFATGKFVKYYEDYVKPDMERVASNFTFDPYTGNITIKHPDYPKYTVQFSQLTRKNDDYAKNLMINKYIENKTLPYQHRFFCLLCQWLANSFDLSALDDLAPEVQKDIKTYWDFTPSNKKGALPSDPHVDSRSGLVTSRLMEYIKYCGRQFLTETSKINDGNTSYKELWDGAEMKLSSGTPIPCPFYYVIHVDFDSVDPEDNPFAGKALTAMNKMIKDILDYREKLYGELKNILGDVTSLQSCVSSVTNLGTNVVEEGAEGSTINIGASCTLDSKGNATNSSTESVTSKENEVDTTKVHTTFVLKRLADYDEAPTAKNKEKKEIDDKKEEEQPAESGNKTVIIIAAIAAIVVVLGIGIWLYKRSKNSGVKNIETDANP